MESSVVYDLCIVGAGMFGSAAARHASAMAGIKVCLVGPDEPTPEEKVSREIFSAHYDEGRIIRTLDTRVPTEILSRISIGRYRELEELSEEKKTREIFSAHYDEGRITHTLDDDVPTEILSRISIGRYRELENLSSIPLYHPVGFLYISKKNSAHMKTVIQAASIIDFPFVDLSYNGIFEKRYPYIKLRSDDQPLLDDCGAGHISPRNMVAAQKKVAKDQGCHIIHKVVEEVKPLADEVHKIITDDGEIITSKRVLICTGAFTNFKKFPIPKLQISINKETVALLKLPLQEAKRLSSMPSIVYCRPEDDIGAYILPPVQYPNGNFYLKIGHVDFKEDENNKVKTLDDVKSWYLSKGNPEKIKRMSNLLIEMIPGLNYEEISEMTCVTCANPGGQPFIDRVSSTVAVAVVGNGRGAKLSDEIGRIAAVLSLTGKWDSELPKSLFSIIPEDE